MRSLVQGQDSNGSMALDLAEFGALVDRLKAVTSTIRERSGKANPGNAGEPLDGLFDMIDEDCRQTQL